VAGYDVAKKPAQVRRNVGYVSQDVGIDEHATGRENLTLYGHFYRLDGKTIKRRVKELFEMVELTEQADKLASTYSGGMRKRLDLAMGLIHQPRLMFLDEPTTGLDPQTRSHIWNYIHRLAKQMGITIFLTTHYMEEADQLADRIAIIDHGKIITIGTPDELKQSIGGDVVTLSSRFSADEERETFVKRTQSLLSGKPFVLETQSIEEGLAVYVDNGESAAPAILSLLAGEGIEVQTLSVSRPSLDDVFLKYTGRTMRAEEGTATTYMQMKRRRGRR
jgi:ABC-2 type transport system ATP-binding protein